VGGGGEGTFLTYLNFAGEEHIQIDGDGDGEG